MTQLHAAGLSDVGRVRDVNEDAYHVGDSVYAVADGMGGHVAGEVASATALEPIKQLDGRVFAEAKDAVQALLDAVIAANATVSQMAADEPQWRGMGTTLTAAMVEGRRIHIAHVGDSRAYLLRDGEFSRLTDDHTLVQHLIDEGHLSPEEAAHHPQRSIITRAIGVSRELDVDALSLELEPGDQLLLCSDGLTGVVADEVIAGSLATGTDLDTTLRQLVDAALEAGGPDNITAIILRYGDVPAPPADDGPATGGVGHPTVRVSTHDDSRAEDWAGRLGSYGALTPGSTTAGRPAGDKEGRSLGRILGRSVAIVLALALLLALFVGGARFLLAQSYFVGLDGEDVVIYQGVNLELGPFDLARVIERTSYDVDDVMPWYARQLADGRPAESLEDARRIVRGMPLRETEEPTGEDEVDAETDGGDT